jgi:hypothetical protein
MTEKGTPQLNDGFSKARNTAVISSGFMYLSNLGDIALPDPIPIIGFSIPDKAITLATLAIIVFYSIFRLTVEWFSSHADGRRQIAARADFIVTLLICLGALSFWSFSSFGWIIPDDISYTLSLFLIIFGLVLGGQLSTTVFTLQLIRDRRTALQKGLPRVPVVTRSSIYMLALFAIFLLAIWGGSYLFSPAMQNYWLMLIMVPGIITCLGGLADIYKPTRHLSDGSTISRKESLRLLQQATDTHDAHYQVGGWDKQAPANPSFLYKAAERGDTATIKASLCKGGNPDETGPMQWAGLH